MTIQSGCFLTVARRLDAVILHKDCGDPNIDHFARGVALATTMTEREILIGIEHISWWADPYLCSEVESEQARSWAYGELCRGLEFVLENMR